MITYNCKHGVSGARIGSSYSAVCRTCNPSFSVELAEKIFANLMSQMIGPEDSARKRLENMNNQKIIYPYDGAIAINEKQEFQEPFEEGEHKCINFYVPPDRVINTQFIEDTRRFFNVPVNVVDHEEITLCEVGFTMDPYIKLWLTGVLAQQCPPVGD